MQALEFHTCGDPTLSIQLTTHPPRPLTQGQVRVKILAAPINPADLNFIQGTYGHKPQLPCIAGMEGCGEILESLHPTLTPGQRVIFLERGQTWASETITNGSSLLPISRDIPLHQAAMLKINPATAWLLLTHFSQLPKGSWIIQNASNSGVGRCIISLAKILGLNTCNFVRGESRIPELLALGANAVLLDNEQSLNTAREILPPNGAHLACNAVGGDSALRLAKLLAKNTNHITYGAMSRRPLTIPNSLLIFKNISFRGLWVTEWLTQTPREEINQLYLKLGQFLTEGTLHQPIDQTFHLNQFHSALTLAQQPNRQGKILFTP